MLELEYYPEKIYFMTNFKNQIILVVLLVTSIILLLHGIFIIYTSHHTNAIDGHTLFQFKISNFFFSQKKVDACVGSEPRGGTGEEPTMFFVKEVGPTGGRHVSTCRYHRSSQPINTYVCIMRPGALRRPFN